MAATPTKEVGSGDTVLSSGNRGALGCPRGTDAPIKAAEVPGADLRAPRNLRRAEARAVGDWPPLLQIAAVKTGSRARILSLRRNAGIEDRPAARSLMSQLGFRNF